SSSSFRPEHDCLGGHNAYRLRSPLPPWPDVVVFLALRRRSAASERPTSSLSLKRPRSSRRTYRLSVPVSMSSRLLSPLRFFVVFLVAMVLFSQNVRSTSFAAARHGP